MTISSVSLTDTFDVQRTRLNSAITVTNDATEGNLVSTGTITLTNPGKFQSNVSLNVHNGVIRGDGGLLWNVNLPNTSIVGKIINSQLSNGYINLVSNNASLYIPRGNTFLGNTTFLTINTSNQIADQSNTNLAAIWAVNFVSILASGAYDKANAANLLAFAQNVTPAFHAANGAFAKANAANSFALAAFDGANNANAWANYAMIAVNSAFGVANTANLSGNLAFRAANASYDKANAANITADASFARANADLISLVVNGNLDAYNNINVIPYCAFAFTVDYAYARIDAGTSIRIQVRNATTNVTNLSALTVTPVPIRNLTTGASSFAVGDRMEIRLTNKTSSEKNLEMLFGITRT